MPKDKSFFDHFEQLGQCLTSVTSALSSYLDQGPGADSCVATMEQNRHIGHQVQRLCLLALDTAFITPFDREDILQLATELYKTIAAVATAGRRMQLYQLEDMHPSLRWHISALHGMAREIAATINQLRKEPKLSSLRANLDEIGRLEETARQHRDQFLLEVFSGQPDPIDVMKKREVHDLMMDGIDRCDRLGRTVERILLKND
jgi:uncharacterized protein Yka (UPF0111/DUF47 family)